MIKSNTYDFRDTEVFFFAKTDYRLKIYDYYFIFAIYLFPSMFLGFADRNWFNFGTIDIRVLELFIPLGLLIVAPGKKFFKIPGIYLFFFMFLYIVFTFFRSHYLDIPFREVGSVMRWNILWPLPTFCYLYAASSMSSEQILKIFKVVVNLFLIQVALGLISSISGIDFFVNRAGMEKLLRDQESMLGFIGNLFAYPRNYVVIPCCFFLLAFARQKYIWASIISVLLPTIMVLRMSMVTIFVSLFIVMLLTALIVKGTKIFKIFYAIMAVVVVGLLVFLIKPDIFDKIEYKWTPNLHGTEFSLENYGSYAFRIAIYADALEYNRKHNCELLGHGYHREFRDLRGDGYSYVLGSDAPIATVIFCEGWMGVAVRLLPILMMLIFGIICLFAKNLQRIYMGIIIIAALLPQTLGYRQTEALTRYDYIFTWLAILCILLFKQEDEAKKMELNDDDDE